MLTGKEAATKLAIIVEVNKTTTVAATLRHPMCTLREISITRKMRCTTKAKSTTTTADSTSTTTNKATCRILTVIITGVVELTATGMTKATMAHTMEGPTSSTKITTTRWNDTMMDGQEHSISEKK